jgi:hypothetical protein
VSRAADGTVLAFTLEVDADERVARTVHLNHHRAIRVAAAARDIVRTGGVPARTWASPRPFPLEYLVGAQLELLLVATGRLRRADRIDHVAAGVACMSLEEASYWHAKIRRPGGMAALRLLLGTGTGRS